MQQVFHLESKLHIDLLGKERSYVRNVCTFALKEKREILKKFLSVFFNLDVLLRKAPVVSQWYLRVAGISWVAVFFTDTGEERKYLGFVPLENGETFHCGKDFLALYYSI